MDDQPKFNSEGDLAARLASLANGTSRVTIEDFEALLKNIPERISATVLNQIINFASDQVGIWEAEYSFSSASSPNTAARAESERWEQLWGTWSDVLLKLAPDVADQIHRRHRLIVAKHSVEKSLQYTSKKPLQRMVAGVLSRIAIGLGKLGIVSIPERLYAFSMYPKGSVGRCKA
jgi:hypothetical protein